MPQADVGRRRVIPPSAAASDRIAPSAEGAGTHCRANRVRTLIAFPTRELFVEKIKEFDAGSLAYLVRGNTHLVHVVADGLDPKVTHTLVIEPVFSKMIEQELRLESICVAGGEAKVLGAEKK